MMKELNSTVFRLMNALHKIDKPKIQVKKPVKCKMHIVVCKEDK